MKKSWLVSCIAVFGVMILTAESQANGADLRAVSGGIFATKLNGSSSSVGRIGGASTSFVNSKVSPAKTKKRVCPYWSLVNQGYAIEAEATNLNGLIDVRLADTQYPMTDEERAEFVEWADDIQRRQLDNWAAIDDLILRDPNAAQCRDA